MPNSRKYEDNDKNHIKEEPHYKTNDNLQKHRRKNIQKMQENDKKKTKTMKM